MLSLSAIMKWNQRMLDDAPATELIYLCYFIQLEIRSFLDLWANNLPKNILLILSLCELAQSNINNITVLHCHIHDMQQERVFVVMQYKIPLNCRLDGRGGYGHHDAGCNKKNESVLIIWIRGMVCSTSWWLGSKDDVLFGRWWVTCGWEMYYGVYTWSLLWVSYVRPTLALPPLVRTFNC